VSPDNHEKDETVGASAVTPSLSAPRIGRDIALAATFSPGDVLATRFRIMRFIAQGGMGEVYEAEDSELGGRVALKTIRSGIAEEAESIDRFKREVHLARQVTHGNVCRIYDVFRQSGITFLTMELLHGETLADRLAHVDRLTTAQARPIVSQIAAGLTAAHRVGVVHRDFKSANVMLVPDAQEEGGVRAVITDFGLARLSRADSGESITATMTGAMAGTPAYMAPEQVEGGPITPATDIYALGVVLYEMVTGARPFTGDTPLSIAVKRLKEAPSSPRVRVRDLDPAWERAILRCLERDPADRFSSASDVARAIAGEKVAGGRAERNRRHLAWTAVVLGLVVAAALGYRLAAGRRGAAESAATAATRMRPSVAVLGFKNLTGRPDAAWVSTALSEMLTTELAAGEKLRTVPGESVARMKSDLALADADSYGKETLTRIRRNIDAGYLVVGSYLAVAGAPVRVDLKLQDATAGETIASVTESGTEAELADLVARAGGKLREKLGAGAISPAQAVAVRASVPANADAARLYAEGLQKMRAFDNLAARDLFEKAIVADPNHALSHAALASAWRAMAYDAKAKAEGKKAFDLAGNLSREDRLSVEGQYRVAAREWPKAIEVYRTLVGLFPDNLEYGLRLADAQSSGAKGKEALTTVETLRRLPQPARDDPRIDLAEASAAYALGDFQREKTAAARARQSADARGARLVVARALYYEGWALYMLGDFPGALKAGQAAQRTYADAGDRGGVALVLADVVSLAPFAQGNVESARRSLADALAISREIGDKRNESAALNNLANLAAQRGDNGEARRMYEQALAVARETDERVGRVIFLSNLAMILQLEGDLPGGEKRAQEALAIAREGGDERGMTMSLTSLGSIAFAKGDLAGAKSSVEEAALLSRKGDSLSYAFAQTGIGEILRVRGDLAAARRKYEEVLELVKKNGVKGIVSERELSLAELDIEEGRPAEGEARVRNAAPEFGRENLRDDQVLATVILARALLAQGKNDEAAKEVEAGRSLSGASVSTRLNLAVTRARVEAALGKTGEAKKQATQALQLATKHGFVPEQLEARLALGEIEMKSGEADSGRARLAGLEKDAQTKGFLLIARKAARARG
jgi:tetratricopeptide (TPR) repeat protein/TolB-like protein/tRNA A-37 threonylcarbamoyl transferase component Bud32